MEDTVAGRRTPHVLSGAARISLSFENFLLYFFSLPRTSHAQPNTMLREWTKTENLPK